MSAAKTRIRFRASLLTSTALTAITLSAVCSTSAQSDQDGVRLKATLVQVPVVVTDRRGSFVGDLGKADFQIFDEGKRQEISIFAALHQPFTAVLVLDSANSTDQRLSAIKQLAIGFSRQLQRDDRMKVITFDDEVRTLTEFTSDQKEIEAAIKGVESGFGKLLYEGVARALEDLREVPGRRAVVLFSDGVDMKSIETNAEKVTRLAEEIGAAVYVIRTNTRPALEAEARRQEAEHPKSNVPFQVDGRIPLPPDFGGPDPTPTGFPKPRKPRIEIGQGPSPPVVYRDGQRIDLGNTESRDPITQTLDKLYGEADSFVTGITARTGGRVYTAETFQLTQSAFADVADELRNQYLLGYYPQSISKKEYRRIKVEVNRKDVVARSRQGYRVSD
jgi:Ca-activated chloride channel family protein